jgi:cytosine deaminase
VTEALRLKPNRLFVIKAGKVIAKTAPRVGELFLAGRPASIDMGRDYVPPVLQR